MGGSLPHRTMTNQRHRLDLAFFTRDRVESCVAAVSGFAELLSPESEQEISIFDDAGESEQREQLRGRLSAVGAAHGVSIFYAGREEKGAYLSKLEELLPSQSKALSFALLPESEEIKTGANCNALLLHHLDQMVLLLADDQRARFCRVGDSQEQAASLSKEADPTTIWRYRTRADALGAPGPSSLDLFAAHREALERPTPMQARVAMSGMWGDCGMSSSAYLWLCRLGNPEQVASHYDEMVDSREVLRGAVSTTLSTSRSPLFMSSGASVDLRTMAPPFLPTGRNQDGFFGLCLQLCDADSQVAYLPIAIGHLPSPRPFALADRLRMAGPPRPVDHMTMAVALSAAAVQGQGGDCAARMQSLGHALKKLADEGRATEALLGEALVLSRRALADRLSQEPAASEMPPAFHRDACAIADATRASCDAGFSQPEESILPLLRNYGELLVAWPSIWRVATALKARGIRLAQPV